MNSTVPHPCVIDLVPAVQPTPFLDWVAQQGYRIELSAENQHVKATLIGTKQAWNSHGEAGISPFVGYAKTKEGAVAELRAACSGSVHHPQARENWLRVVSGPECCFPRFVN